MLRKIIIKNILRVLVKMIESKNDYGSCTDYGISKINTEFDEHIITVKKL